MQAGAAARHKRRQVLVQEEQQQQQRNQEYIYELNSLWVDPSFRGQQIGTELVQRCLKRTKGLCSPSDLYLVTPVSNAAWYRDKFGFKLVSPNQIPEQLLFGMATGGFVSSLFKGVELLCMNGSEKESPRPSE